MTVLRQGQGLLARTRSPCLSHLGYRDTPADPVPSREAFCGRVNGEACAGGHPFAAQQLKAAFETPVTLLVLQRIRGRRALNRKVNPL